MATPSRFGQTAGSQKRSDCNQITMPGLLLRTFEGLRRELVRFTLKSSTLSSSTIRALCVWCGTEADQFFKLALFPSVMVQGFAKALSSQHSTLFRCHYLLCWLKLKERDRKKRGLIYSLHQVLFTESYRRAEKDCLLQRRAGLPQ